MTEQTDDESVLRDWLSVLARQKWIVLLALTVVPLFALAASRGQERVYQASSTVLVDAQNPTAQALNLASTAPASPPDRYVATQAKLARVGNVAATAVRAAHLRGHTAAALLANSTVSADVTSDLLTFSVKDHSPAAAVSLANAYARQFTLYRRALDGAGLSAAIADARRKLGALLAAGSGGSRLSRRLRATVGDLEQLQTLQAVGSSATVVGAADGASLVQPRTKRNVVLGVIVGLALGIALAFIREALDTRVRSADEMRARLGMPLLGQVPRSDRGPVRSRQPATLTEPTSESTEAFRITKNRLEFSQLEHGVGSIVVTSPRADEDKSTTAANLAVLLAQSGQHVILVDLNLRDPGIDRLFGLPGLGFTGVATGAELTDALNIVDIRSDRLDADPGRLEVLTAGEPPPDPGEFLMSSSVAEVLAALDKRCDVLLIDTPPVLAVGDAMTIAKHTDAVVLVAGVNRVRRETLIETRHQLDGCAAIKLGVIATAGYAAERGSYPQRLRTTLKAARGVHARWKRLLATPSARLVREAAKKLVAEISSSAASMRARVSTRTRRNGRAGGLPERARAADRAELHEGPRQVPDV